MDKEIIDIASQLGVLLKSKGLKIATAESCTGGGIAKAITDVPGSSQWFDRGFVTYSNQAKIDMLGVKAETLEFYGAVSEETALEMAEGALQFSGADMAIAVTGIAGPEGGTNYKPVGIVYIALAVKSCKTEFYKKHFSGNRISIRQQTIQNALILAKQFKGC